MKYLCPQNQTSTGLDSNQPPTELATGAAAAARHPRGRRQWTPSTPSHPTGYVQDGCVVKLDKYVDILSIVFSCKLLGAYIEWEAVFQICMNIAKYLWSTR
jgi:hypothetical protein